MADSAFVYEVHNYERDPQSGAGNCLHCGNPVENKRHPHEFRKAANFNACVCMLSVSATIHQIRRI